MVPAQIQKNAYTGSVGRPMTSQPATKATPQTDIAITRRRPPSRGVGGSVGAGGWASVTADIADKVSGDLGPTGHRSTCAVVAGTAHLPGRVIRASPSTYAVAMRESSDQALAPGLTARVELTVTDADTAQAVGSGDVPVLGTPRVLALAEAATVAATARQLPSGSTTVGTRVELAHLAATPVGRTVAAQARLTEVDRRRLVFEVDVTDGGQTVAEGRVERVVVDRLRFMQRAGGAA
ncbi:hypothetical protein Van01_62710 [Micromonospora andamanensis]|uniref:Fluoroacetyl-CoA-specific thioesterase-like domain-containing protein n=2 Tax=Micromonospora andamanensis TaxID=1287068 RepID=A0ABQ4I587_9ACTN|nr:hypothetical protein Van01_62710 [Micromonospora andamanensis]